MFMLKSISFGLLLMISIQSSAQTGGKQSVNNKFNEDVMQLSALNAQFIQNFLHNDTVAHNKIIYKDFVCIVSNGNVVKRDDYMKGWSHGYDPSFYRSFAMQNELIRIFGNTALVRAETVYRYIDNGKEAIGTTVYTDTYIKLDGRWWCIQAQLTPKK
jgi:hypothetical protein